MGIEVKRFTTPDPTEGDPIPFSVEVVRTTSRLVEVGEGEEPRTEQVQERDTLIFGARPDVSGGVLLAVEMMGGLGARRKNARGSDALMDFYDAALMPSDGVIEQDGEQLSYLGLASFRKMIDDPDTYVHIDVLIDLGTWLYGVYSSGRPTKPRRQ